MRCWLAKLSDEPCEGRLDPVHLVNKQVLRRRAVDSWDRRSFVPGCRHHHNQFDQYQLTVPYESLPTALLSLCEELGLGWYLDRRFRPAVSASLSP